MKNILLVLGSPRDRASYSHQIARRVVDDLKSRYPGAKVVVRNFAREPLPEVSEGFVTGRMVGKDQRSATEAKAMALSEVLVGELMAADVLVLATPMHNFGVSASVKSWIDHIARPGVTFSYSDKGPKGLATGKKVILVLARGGIYSEGPMKQYDFQEPYLRAVLGLLGMTDLEVIRIEGVALGEDALRAAVTSAKAKADEIVRLTASESAPTLAEAA